MTPRKAAVATVGTLVVVYAGLKVVGLAASKKDVEVLLQSQAGVCQPSDPDTIKAGFLNKVKWTIRNVDCSPQYIALRNFKHPIGGGQYDPAENVVTPNSVEGGPIGTGQTITIDARVIKFRLLHKLYKYEIWLGDTPANLQLRRDPDIDVWP
jgi:hypothetical protein